MNRQVSNRGIELIKSFEGCRLKAYKCLPTEQFYTIGYGHYGADVAPDMVITQEQAELMLLTDIQKYVDRVNYYMDTYDFNQNQFDALVSFCYNVGSIHNLTDRGKRTIYEISIKMMAYVKSGGQIIKGLVTRRKKELELFITPVKTNEELAKEVLDGLWGNNEDRKNALTKAGYDYQAVQNIVNRILQG